MESLLALSYKGAKSPNGFTIPGLGKLIKVKRKARWGRNPATGEKIKIKAKTDVKFRLSKVAKDAVLPPKK
jgi:DNA-binding protein HU-beta